MSCNHSQSNFNHPPPSYQEISEPPPAYTFSISVPDEFEEVEDPSALERANTPRRGINGVQKHYTVLLAASYLTVVFLSLATLFAPKSDDRNAAENKWQAFQIAIKKPWDAARLSGGIVWLSYTIVAHRLKVLGEEDSMRTRQVEAMYNAVSMMGVLICSLTLAVVVVYGLLVSLLL